MSSKDKEIFDDDEIEVEIEDTRPEEDRREIVDLDELDEESLEDEIQAMPEKFQKRVRELTHRYHNERRRAEQEKRVAEEATRSLQEIQSRYQEQEKIIHQGRGVLTSSVKAKAEAALERGRELYRQAHEAGDTDKMLQAQEIIDQARDEMRWVAAQTRQMQAKPKEEPKQEAQQRETRVEPPKPDERALSWQRKNQWFGSDREMTAVALAIHQDLLENGLNGESDDYYKKLDSRLRKRFPDKFGEGRSDGGDEEQRSSRRSPVASTSSRSGDAAGRRTGKRTIRLTESQAEIARRLGISPERYAKEYALEQAKNGAQK